MKAFVENQAQICTGLFDNPAPHVHDQPGVFCKLDELRRRDLPKNGVLPTHQRFCPADNSIAKAKLRLVVNGERLAIKCSSKIPLQLNLASALSIQFLAKKFEPGPAGFLCSVHRRVRVFQERFYTAAVIRKYNDSDTPAKKMIFSTNHECFAQPFQNSRSCRPYNAVSCQVRHKNHEFIPAKPCNRVSLPDFGQNPFSRLGQNNVTDRVTENVIDFLETIQIDEQNSAAVIVTPCLYKMLLETVLQKLSIGQPGKFVKMSLFVQGFLTLRARERNRKAACQID